LLRITPTAVVPYLLVSREELFKSPRLYHQRTGYWHQIGQGRSTVALQKKKLRLACSREGRDAFVNRR